MNSMSKGKWWINRNALLLNLSAFFADMGYQAILAGFPVFLVLMLGAPAYMLGIAYAIAYGGGALLGYVGGYLGDLLGRKRMALTGNLFILLLPLLGLSTGITEAIALFSSGWWSRNFRTPPRRAMLSEVTTKRERGLSFGLLHVFDLGGGAIAVTYLLVLLYLKANIKTVFLLTAIPLIVSSICLSMVKAGKLKDKRKDKRVLAENKSSKRLKANSDTLRGMLVATALFGFSFYSLGFPILTIAQESHSDLIGVASYFVFLLFSAAAGYLIGSNARRMNLIKGLAVLGYTLAAVASLLIGVAYAFGPNLLLSYFAVALLGIALGSIETFEPTIISFISKDSETSKGMGYLTFSRSTGLFMANILMGLLYVVSPVYSYAYAFVISLIAAGVLAYSGRNFKV